MSIYSAKTLAVGSISLLENAKVYTSLENCIADLSVVVATSARIRHHAQRPMTAAQCASLLMPLVEAQQQQQQEQQEVHQKVGIMFGSETNGLSASEMSVAHFRVGVPTFEHYGVLNLAQAVSILTYECWAYLSNRGEEAQELQKVKQQQQQQLQHDNRDSNNKVLIECSSDSNTSVAATASSTAFDSATSVTGTYRQRHQYMLAALSDGDQPAQRGSVVSFLNRLQGLLNSPVNNAAGRSNNTIDASKGSATTTNSTSGDETGRSPFGCGDTTVGSVTTAVDNTPPHHLEEYINSKGVYTERNMRDIKAIFQRVS